jgi:hypothetical protein
MLPIGWVIAAIVLAILLTSWVIFTATRLDRLHARVDAALASLDVQLVRRAGAVRHVLETAQVRSGPLALPPADERRFYESARFALTAAGDEREAAENQLGHVVSELAALAMPVSDDDAIELHEAGVRVVIARRFYNDAVRDTRELRSGLMPRILHLAGHREMPQFFDIDDTFVFPDPAAAGTDYPGPGSGTDYPGAASGTDYPGSTEEFTP